MPEPEDFQTVKLPELDQLSGQAEADDKVFVWDTSASQLKFAEVSQMPAGSGGGGGGGGGTYYGSPFRVTNSSLSYTFDGTDTIIEDIRLVGKSDYPVYSTQLNTELRAADVVYDAENGILTIADFELLTGEHLSISPDGLQATNAQFVNILADVNLLKAILAPFMPSTSGPSGGMVLWNKPVSVALPPGWQEVVDWRGRMAIGFDPDDVDFDEIGTKFGGSKDVTMTLENLIEHDHEVPAPDRTGRSDNANDRDVMIPGGADRTEPAGSADPTPMAVMNPYRTVMFIEFVGV